MMSTEHQRNVCTFLFSRCSRWDCDMGVLTEGRGCLGALYPGCDTRSNIVLMHAVLNGALYFARRRQDSVVAAAPRTAFRQLHAVGLARRAAVCHRTAKSQHHTHNTVISCTISGPWATQDCGHARRSRCDQAGSARRDECMNGQNTKKEGPGRVKRAQQLRERAPSDIGCFEVRCGGARARATSNSSTRGGILTHM